MNDIVFEHLVSFNLLNLSLYIYMRLATFLINVNSKYAG